MKNLMLLLFVVTVVFSCSPSTEIVKTWKEPGATVTPGPTNKVLVVAMVKDETSRRLIEDQLAQRKKRRRTELAHRKCNGTECADRGDDHHIADHLEDNRL